MRKIWDTFSKILFVIFSLFPLRNEILGSSFYGYKYENNPRFVIEKLHTKYPDLKIAWIKNPKAKFKLPEFITPISSRVRMVFRYATAKVIIDSHFVPMYFKKRKGQLAIFMYHGGIGIKRNSNEVPGRKKSKVPRHNADNMSFFITNSRFTSRVIRTSLEYEGPILKCGYPKDDLLFEEPRLYKERVCKYYCLPDNTRLFLYAPTYRQDLEDCSGFDIDLETVRIALSAKWGGEWTPIVKWHPKQKITVDQTKDMYGINVIDASDYDSMQELIVASDAFISDYSSCIFEAAARKIPCFSYANDWEVFRHEQGVHFEIDELPFPYCKNNDELIEAIGDFDDNQYQRELARFFEKEGMYETGNASETLADIIFEYVNGEKEEIIHLDCIEG